MCIGEDRKGQNLDLCKDKKISKPLVSLVREERGGVINDVQNEAFQNGFLHLSCIKDKTTFPVIYPQLPAPLPCLRGDWLRSAAIILRGEASGVHVNILFPYKLYILEIQMTGLNENRSTVLKISDTLINFKIISDGQCIMVIYCSLNFPLKWRRHLKTLLYKLLLKDKITHFISLNRCLLKQAIVEFLYLL